MVNRAFYFKELIMRKEKEIELPSWLDPTVWFDYVDHRRILKKPMSKRAKELAIMKLDRLRQHEDPRFIVDRSIEGGWQALYPKKEKIESSLTKAAESQGIEPRPGESWDEFERRVRQTRN